jgi:hypothetical protein
MLKKNPTQQNVQTYVEKKSNLRIFIAPGKKFQKLINIAHRKNSKINKRSPWKKSKINKRRATFIPDCRVMNK